MRILTAAQRRAVETCDRDLCVVAGAGSGKTSVLAERFVHLVLAKRVPIDGILALTFTEKAAVEMRERVAREFTRRGRADLRRETETARVSTFHAFCARLLKENAVEAGVDPSFAILTGTEASVLRERARDEVVARRLRDDPASLEPLALLATTRNGLAEDLAGLLDRARGTGRRFEGLFEAEATPPDLLESSVALVEALAVLRGGLGSYSVAGETRAKRVLAVAEALPPAGTDADAFDGALSKIAAAVNLLCGDPAKANLRAVKDEALAARAILVAIRAAPVARALADLLREWDGEYERFKGGASGAASGGARLDFADLERLALALLDDSKEVREEVRSRFEHVLVDEFQDTNPVQEELLGLVRKEDRLFVVGDPKQAIYGFRGVDRGGFARARAAAGDEGTIPLRENFRSRPEILGFVNAVLEPAFRAGGEDQAPWEPLVAGAEFDPKAVPSVELHLVAPAAEGEKAPELRVREAALLAERLRTLVEGGGIAVTARSAGGEPLARPLRWGDAAILLRATTDMKVYERALAERDVPYTVVQGRGFYESREIVDLANLLASVENPRDELSLAAVLRSPFAGLDDDALLALARERGRRKEAVLADLLEGRGRVSGLEGAARRRFDRFRAVFARLRAARGRGRLVEVVERAIAETGFGDAVLLQRNGRQRAANLRKVRELARTFESDGAGGLPEFTAAVRRLRLREERETEAPLAGEDAVALLSVHQAKGLEWPLVFVPDVGRRPPSGSDPILVEGDEAAVTLRGRAGNVRTPRRERLGEARKAREAAESIRVLHVAMTRAREHLVLSGSEPAKGGGGPWKPALLAALGEGALPDGPGEADLPVPAAPGTLVRFSRTVEPAPARGRRAQSLLERRRSRFLAGKGPGERIPAALRRGARAAVERVASLPPVAIDGTPYLSTVSALLDFESCPLRWFWRHRVGVPERDFAVHDTPGVEDEELEAGARTGDHGVPRRVTGTAVHAVLGNLDFAGDDGSQVRASAAARLREELEEEPPAAAVEEVARWVEALRASPLGRELAEAARAGRLHREVPFLLKDEGVLLRGQIDLAWRDAAGRWTVADYKASPPPRRPGGTGRYERQIHYYVRALRATPLLGSGDPVRGALVYLDPAPVVVEVEAGPTAREAAGAVLRRFARLVAAEEHPPDRRHCRACPYGPSGLASCPEA